MELMRQGLLAGFFLTDLEGFSLQKLIGFLEIIQFYTVFFEQVVKIRSIFARYLRCLSSLAPAKFHETDKICLFEIGSRLFQSF